jgi:hypothetical protein
MTDVQKALTTSSSPQCLTMGPEGVAWCYGDQEKLFRVFVCFLLPLFHAGFWLDSFWHFLLLLLFYPFNLVSTNPLTFLGLLYRFFFFCSIKHLFSSSGFLSPCLVLSAGLPSQVTLIHPLWFWIFASLFIFNRDKVQVYSSPNFYYLLCANTILLSSWKVSPPPLPT